MSYKQSKKIFSPKQITISCIFGSCILSSAMFLYNNYKLKSDIKAGLFLLLSSTILTASIICTSRELFLSIIYIYSISFLTSNIIYSVSNHVFKNIPNQNFKSTIITVLYIIIINTSLFLIFALNT
jgi:hypothetical protein